MALCPRVVKQSRGVGGEGFWVIQLQDKTKYVTVENEGQDALDDSVMLTLTEGNDGHIEEHTVGEFIEYCSNGRGPKSGDWKSVGKGK